MSCDQRRASYLPDSLGRLFEALFERPVSFILIHFQDPEQPDPEEQADTGEDQPEREPVSFDVTFRDPSLGRIHLTRDSLHDALRAVCEWPMEHVLAERKCLGPCGLLKTVDQFAVDRQKRTGRRPYCLACDRAAKAAAKRAAAAG